MNCKLRNKASIAIKYRLDSSSQKTANKLQSSNFSRAIKSDAKLISSRSIKPR